MGAAPLGSAARGNASPGTLFQSPLRSSGLHPRLTASQRFSYLQLRPLPAAIHSTASAMRLSRVASVCASLIHSQ